MAMRALDRRVASIGHSLATSAIDLCGHREWLPGFAIHALSQYGGDYRETAARTFGLDASAPNVLALAADGPAERAGLAPDDRLLAADGRPLPVADEAESGAFGPVERMMETLEEAFSDGAAELAIERADQPLTVRVEAEEGCLTRFQLIPSAELNARADGRYVQITTAIGDYVQDDAELAAIIAHELAHNILRHKDRLDGAEVKRGFLSNFGRNARLIRETETEADRLSIYLLDRAGYDPEAAVRFWTRFGPRGIGLFNSPTHPGWRSRVELFREEIDSIARQKAAGTRPLPAFLQSAAAAEATP